jgi:hypothetical protein
MMIDWSHDVLLGLIVHYFKWTKSYIAYWYGKKGLANLNTDFIAVSKYASFTSWRFPEGVLKVEVGNMDCMEAIAYYMPFCLLRYKELDPIFQVALLFQSWISNCSQSTLTKDKLQSNYLLICR